MERLQQALQKAREQRAITSSVTPGAAPAAAATRPVTPAQAAFAAPVAPEPEASDADALWDALSDIDLDPEFLKKNRVVSMAARRESTTFDILRTKVQLMMQKNGWKRLAVTSPTPGCGKTTTACNLALGLSRQKDMRTILIELDLSRPMVSKMLGFTAPHNMSAMLRRDVGFAETAVKARPNVAIAATRKASSDPTTVLLAQQTQDILQEIEETYKPDMMVFDLPPILVSDETRAFLNNVDAAMMLAKAESTTVAQIDFCEKEIAEHTNVLGIVLNQCRHVDDISGYYDTYYSYG